MTAIQVTCVTPEEFAGMREEWTRLLEQSDSAGPMLTWEWMSSWWECYREAGVHRDLRLLAARGSDGALLGLAPLVLRPAHQYGIRVKRLEFLGTGEDESDETCSEYLDFLVVRERKSDVMKAFADSLSRADDWDEMMLRDMRMDSTASAWLLLSDRAMLSRGRFRADPFGSARCPYIPLPHCWEDYLAAMSRNSRQLLRRKRRVLESKAETAYSSTEDPEKIQDAMRNFASLHQLRWEERDRPGCFASVVFDGFIRKVTPRLADAGKLRLGSLRIDGTPAAMYYLLKDGDRLFYYNSGVDVQRFGPLSPGSVCLGYVIEEAIRRGEKEFHFLKGGADSYKWHWTDQSVLVNSMIVRRKGWKDSVCVCNARLIEWMRASFRTCSPRVSRT